MRCVAIINQKGGVGKTTTAVHLAAGLARAGQRVLLVDLDPQAHASLHLGVQLASGEPGTYDVLLSQTPVAGATREVAERLALLPAGIDLVGAELELGARHDRDRLLTAALATQHESFDWCLIDCPPSLGLLTVNALTAASEVIIPLQPHFLALQGLGRLLDTVTLAREALNPRLRVAGIVLCMFEKGTRLAQEVLDDITQFVAQAQPTEAWYGAHIFQTKIRRTVKLAEAPSFGQTVFDYAPGSHGAEDYLALTAELHDGLSASSAAAAPVSRPIADVGNLPEPLPTHAEAASTQLRPGATARAACSSTSSHGTSAP